MDRIVVSSHGLVRLKASLAKRQAEYDVLRAERRDAYELSGDGWHDNSQFNRLQQQEAEMTRQIAVLSAQIDRAQVLDIVDGRRPVSAIRYGSIVSVSEAAQATTIRTWEIVGFDETNPARHQLSYASPLGRLLMGLEPGDQVQFAGRTLTIEALHDTWAAVPVTIPCTDDAL